MWQVFCKYLWRFTLQRNSGESLWCCQQSSQTFLQARKRGKLSWLFVVFSAAPWFLLYSMLCWYLSTYCTLQQFLKATMWHQYSTDRYTHTHLTALFPGLPRWAGTKKVKPTWILLKQETVSGSGISWAICKSPPHSRQITMPAPHHSVFYRPDAFRATQSTASKHWRQIYHTEPKINKW